MDDRVKLQAYVSESVMDYIKKIMYEYGINIGAAISMIVVDYKKQQDTIDFFNKNSDFIKRLSEYAVAQEKQDKK